MLYQNMQIINGIPSQLQVHKAYVDIFLVILIKSGPNYTSSSLDFKKS